MTLDVWAKLATVASPLLSAIVAFLVLRFTVEVQRQSQRLTLDIKRSDVLSDFHRRFAAIAELRLREAVKAVPSFYYGQYWSLQKDQFEAWNSGLVSNEQFKFWMDSRCIDWKENEALGKCRYQDAYIQVLSKWAETDFKRFMGEVHMYGSTEAISRHEKLNPMRTETYRKPLRPPGVYLLRRRDER